jgi:hypothetical protein
MIKLLLRLLYAIIFFVGIFTILTLAEQKYRFNITQELEEFIIGEPALHIGEQVPIETNNEETNNEETIPEEPIPDTSAPSKDLDDDGANLDDIEEPIYDCESKLLEPTGEQLTWVGPDNVTYCIMFSTCKVSEMNEVGKPELTKIYDTYVIGYLDETGTKHYFPDKPYLIHHYTDINSKYSIKQESSNYIEINDSLAMVILRMKNSNKKMISILKYQWSDKYNKTIIDVVTSLRACICAQDKNIQVTNIGNRYTIHTNPELILRLNQTVRSNFLSYYLTVIDNPNIFATVSSVNY